MVDFLQNVRFMAFLCKWILPKLHWELLLLLYAICKIPKAIKSPEFKIVTMTTICQITICSAHLFPRKIEFSLIFISLYKPQNANERFVSCWAEKLENIVSKSFFYSWKSVQCGRPCCCLPVKRRENFWLLIPSFYEASVWCINIVTESESIQLYKTQGVFHIYVEGIVWSRIRWIRICMREKVTQWWAILRILFVYCILHPFVALGNSFPLFAPFFPNSRSLLCAFWIYI